MKMTGVAVLCATCGVWPATAAQSNPPAADEMAPTPYTAEQIHGNSPAGRLFRFRVEEEGKVVLQQTRFLTSAEDNAEIEVSTLDEQGKVIESRKSKVTWAQLQGHARFPKAATSITEEKVTTRLGTFDAIVYHVDKASGKRMHFVFAKDRPGPPVRYWAEMDGRTVMSAEMIAFE